MAYMCVCHGQINVSWNKDVVLLHSPDILSWSDQQAENTNLQSGKKTLYVHYFVTCIVLVGEYHFPSQTPCEDNKDFALLRFHGGPPYEVIDTHIQCTCTYIHILGDLQADYMYMYTYMYISVVMCGDLAVDLCHISKYMYTKFWKALSWHSDREMGV